MTEFDHKNASTVDSLRLLGEIEHTRFHLLMAAANCPEEEIVPTLTLAKRCMDIRRELMKKKFDVKERHWCLVKCSARMLQIVEEIGGSDIDELKDVKHLIDETILLATGDDISGCESCKTDMEQKTN